MRAGAPLVVAVALGVGLVGALTTAGQAPAARTARKVTFNAFDQSGGYVEDLAADDLTVKENGKTRDVVAVRPAKGLMQIALIVDDNGTGLLPRAALPLRPEAAGRAEFAIVTRRRPAAQAHRLHDGRQGPDRGAHQPVGPARARRTADSCSRGSTRPRCDLEKREAPRPIIVALSVPGEEHTTLPARHVLDKLKDSGASLHVFLVANSPRARWRR